MFSRFQLPFWLQGEQLSLLKKASDIYLGIFHSALKWTQHQYSPKTCDIGALKIIGWQYGCELFEGETEAEFRIRVETAMQNFLDSGSVVGFKAIFARLGLGVLEIEERLGDQDWDIVKLNVTDEAMAKSDLVNWTVGKFGRTCLHQFHF